MKLLSPVFDVGFEWEYFIGSYDYLKIYNASKIMEAHLGFSIDQNNSKGKLDLGDGLMLRTDGTVMEAQFYAPNLHGILPSHDMFFGKINAIRMPFACTRMTEPYVEKGEKGLYSAGKVAFQDPGNVFSSCKQLINAYTGAARWADKKEEDKLVTFRSAGLHFHFSVCPRSVNFDVGAVAALNEVLFNNTTYKHTNALVIMLDGLYEEIFKNSHCWEFSDKSKKRCEKYQILGDYRIKRDTKSGNPTLEYRQLDSSMLSWMRVQNLLDTFQIEAARYLRTII